MANYKELEGFGVQTLATDPDSAGWAGSIFYNSTSGTFKTVKPGGIAAGTWASGGTLNNSRVEAAAGVGTQTAAMIVGRSPAPAAVTEQYNGSAWTEVADLNSARGRGQGAGASYTSALVFGGVLVPADTTSALNESWNGSSWTEVGDLPTARSDGGGFGTQTAAILAGGNRGTPTTATFSWNGTSWASATAINTARGENAAAGIQTAGIIFGGREPANSVATELYNGSTWTTTSSMNTGRYLLGGFGTQTSAIASSGTPATTSAEAWDGSTWTTVSSLANPATSQNTAAGADNTSGLVAAGTATEEWNAPEVVINTLTTS